MHSLDSDDFEEKDAEAALNFGGAAADAGVDRIIYLGGLGVDDGELSAHLRSRRQVEQLLGVAGVPVTVLRAAVVVGHGGISWEITRQLVDHLPAMITPEMGQHPHAADRAARRHPLPGRRARPSGRRAARSSRSADPRCCATSTCSSGRRRCRASTCRASACRCCRPRLSSGWLALVTDVDLDTARNLVDSMTNEVVVKDRSIEKIVPGPTMGYDDAVRLALADRAKAAQELAHAS